MPKLKWELTGPIPDELNKPYPDRYRYTVTVDHIEYARNALTGDEVVVFLRFMDENLNLL